MNKIKVIKKKMMVVMIVFVAVVSAIAYSVVTAPLQSYAEDEAITSESTTNEEWIELDITDGGFALPTTSGSYRLVGDVDGIGITDRWIPGNDATINVDLNGHVLTMAYWPSDNSGSWSPIYLAEGSNAELNIYDYSEEQSGGIQGDNHLADDNGGGICVNAGCRFNLYGGTISKFKSGGQSPKGRPNDPGYSGRGGAIYSNWATVKILGGTIEECTASYAGGAIYSNNGIVEIGEGSIIQKCLSPQGGAIASCKGTVNITGGEIKNNKATWGSGVMTFTKQYGNVCYFNMSGGSIYGNMILPDGMHNGEGGGLYLGETIAQITGGTISQNTNDYGGGIETWETSLTISADDEENPPIIAHNHAYRAGGAIYVYGGYWTSPNKETLTINNGIISENSAPTMPGICGEQFNFMMSGGTITGTYLAGDVITTHIVNAALVLISAQDPSYTDINFMVYGGKIIDNYCMGIFCKGVPNGGFSVISGNIEISNNAISNSTGEIWQNANLGIYSENPDDCMYGVETYDDLNPATRIGYNVYRVADSNKKAISYEEARGYVTKTSVPYYGEDPYKYFTYEGSLDLAGSYNDGGLLYLSEHVYDWKINTESDNQILVYDNNEGSEYTVDNPLITSIDGVDTEYTGDFVVPKIRDEIRKHFCLDDSYIYYEGISPTEYEETIIPPIEIGHYKATLVTQLPDSNESAYVSSSFYIYKNLDETMVSISPNTFEYDGTEKSPEVKVVDGETDISDLVKIEGDTKATEVGDYTINVSGNDEIYRNSVSANWTITGSVTPTPTPTPTPDDPGSGGDVNGGTATSDFNYVVVLIVLAELVIASFIFVVRRKFE